MYDIISLIGITGDRECPAVDLAVAFAGEPVELSIVMGRCARQALKRIIVVADGSYPGCLVNGWGAVPSMASFDET